MSRTRALRRRCAASLRTPRSWRQWRRDCTVTYPAGIRRLPMSSLSLLPLPSALLLLVEEGGASIASITAFTRGKSAGRAARTVTTCDQSHPLSSTPKQRIQTTATSDSNAWWAPEEARWWRRELSVGDVFIAEERREGLLLLLLSPPVAAAVEEDEDEGEAAAADFSSVDGALWWSPAAAVAEDEEAVAERTVSRPSTETTIDCCRPTHCECTTANDRRSASEGPQKIWCASIIRANVSSHTNPLRTITSSVRSQHDLSRPKIKRRNKSW